MVSLTSLVTLLATAAAAAHAAPVMEPQVELAVGRDGLALMEERWQAQAQRSLAEREVINCEITSPTADSVWTAGEEVKVTWDPACVSDDKFKDYTGTILLGYTDLLSPGSNLNVDAPLADNFALKSGSESFTLPSNLTEKASYFVVLMGDSGNKSPAFTIKA